MAPSCRKLPVCWLQMEHPACVLKVEMPPPSAAAVQLRELGDPAFYTAFNRILSVFLESTDITQTSNGLNLLLPGQTPPWADVRHPQTRLSCNCSSKSSKWHVRNVAYNLLRTCPAVRATLLLWSTRLCFVYSAGLLLGLGSS